MGSVAKGELNVSADVLPAPCVSLFVIVKGRNNPFIKLLRTSSPRLIRYGYYSTVWWRPDHNHNFSRNGGVLALRVSVPPTESLRFGAFHPASHSQFIPLRGLL